MSTLPHLCVACRLVYTQRLSTHLNTNQHISTQFNTSQKGRYLLYLKRNKCHLCVYLCRRCPICMSPVDWHTHSGSQHSSTPLNTSQHLSTHLNTSQHLSTHLNTSRHTSQHISTHFNTSQHIPTHRPPLPYHPKNSHVSHLR